MNNILSVVQSAGPTARAFFLGVVCAIAQVFIFRALMGALYGNEQVFISMMVGWAAGIAVGSLLGKPSCRWEALILLAVGLLTAVLLFIPFVRGWLGLGPGQAGHMGWMLAAGFILTLPVSIVCGMCYAALARGQGVKVYGVESLGFAAGGVLSWLILISPAHLINKALWSVQWPGYEVLSAVETPNASLVAASRGEAVSVFENSLHQATSSDPLTAEEIVHYAVLSHPKPKRLLLLGAAATGAVAEALKYPELQIDCVERNSELIRMAERYLPNETASLRDPRVKVLIGDGRSWVGQSRSSYDVIIVASGEPVSFLSNRYYTKDFFAQANRALKPGGLLAISLPGAEEYVSQAGRAVFSLVKSTLGKELPYVRVFPGGRYLFLAGKSADMLSLDAETMVQRMEGYGLQNQYVTGHSLVLRLTESRIRQAEKTASLSVAANSDLRPSGVFMYLHYLDSQTSKFIPLLKERILRYLWVLWLAPLLMMIWAFRAAWRPAAAVFSAGFSQITLQICVIVLFQERYGYIYSALGLLTALFMLGLYAGTRYKVLTIRQVQLAGATVLLGALYTMSGVVSGNHWHAAFWLGGIPVLCGLVAGSQFKSALNHCPEKPALLYAVDVIGTAVGALLCGLFLIPLWGMPVVISFCIFLQMAVAIAEKPSLSR